MITTRHGMHVKFVSLLDEQRQLATVIGFQKQVTTIPIGELKAENGIQELRESHQRYLKMIASEPTRPIEFATNDPPETATLL